jgi:hypothetical protein
LRVPQVILPSLAAPNEDVAHTLDVIFRQMISFSPVLSRQLVSGHAAALNLH